MPDPVATAGAESFTCPTCKASAGQPCTAGFAATPAKPHDARNLLYLHEIQAEVRAKSSAGRPEIGGAVHVRLGGALLFRVDRYAERHGANRAEAIRQLIDFAISAGAD